MVADFPSGRYNGLMGDLVEEARALLADGEQPEEAFIALAVDGRPQYEVALAVCVAVGIPEADAVERLKSGLFWEHDEGLDTEEMAWVFDYGGLFDLPNEPSAEDQQIADQLWRDYRAHGDKTFDNVCRFGRLIRRGRLDEARRYLEEHPERR